MRLLILVTLVILAIGALPSWPYSSGWGDYPIGGPRTTIGGGVLTWNIQPTTLTQEQWGECQ